MCLSKLTTQEPLTAHQNIFCWKSLDKDRISQHRDYVYCLGLLQPETVDIKVRKHWSGNIIQEGYHSWVKRNKSNHLFVIPKGEKYYEGIQHDDNLGYASSNIICLGHVYSPITWFRAFKYQSQNDNNAKTK